jgi:hypothetical protein
MERPEAPSVLWLPIPETILLLEGSQASPVGPSDNSNM